MTAAEGEARLGFLEAAYDWSLPEDEWLTKLVVAAGKVWGGPSFGYAYVYDVSDPNQIRFGRPAYVGPDPFRKVLAGALERIAKLPPAVITASYRSVPIGFGRPLDILDEETLDGMAANGAYDIFAFNALDASGNSCAIGLGVERSSLTDAEVLLFQRLNSHLASAYRCRRKLMELHKDPLEDSDAIFDPDGKLVEARGLAKEGPSRAALDRAAHAMEEVRQHKTEAEPTSSWLPRVRSRWTFVDAYTKGGDRYVVARDNQANAPGLEALTERERQVAASAALGKSAKEIAYDLGISASTVRVLLVRARSRLGVQTEEQFRQLPVIRALRGG